MSDNDTPFNGSKFKNALKRLIYMSNGEFSLTRLMMVASFGTSIILVGIGVVSFLEGGKVLPDNLYDYAFKISGGGIINYGITKLRGKINNKSNKEEGES